MRAGSARRAAGGAVRLGSIAGALACVAGCMAVPTGGPVHAGAQGGADGGEGRNIQVPAAYAVEGLSPKDVVGGFRLASEVLSNPAISRSYLADPSWQPTGGVHVIDESGELVVFQINGDTATVRVIDKWIGTIFTDGTYQPEPAGATADITYTLTKSAPSAKGEWRISKLPDYLVLDRSEVENAFQQGYVYYLSPGGQFLVPVRVFVPRTATDFAAALVAQLVQPVPGWLAKAGVFSALPASDQAPTVTISAGVATVDLPPQFANLNGTERDQASAQITYTLLRTGLANQVRIDVGGQPLPNSRQASLQTLKTWSAFDPDVIRSSGFVYVDSSGVVRSQSGERLVPEQGETSSSPGGPSASPGAQPGTSPPHFVSAVPAPRVPGSAGPDLLAAVSRNPDNTEDLYVGPVNGLKKVLSAGSFTTPSWDLLGNVWTVQQGPGGSQQVVVGVATATSIPKFQGVSLDANLSSNLIVGLKVSRDGTRVALVTKSTTGSQLWIGRIERTEAGVSIGGLYPLAPNLQPVVDGVSWASATTLAVLATSSGSDTVTAWFVDVDGWQTTLQQVPFDATTLSAIPNAPLVIGTKSKQIEVLNGAAWQVVVNAGAAPNYPG
ncbi:MAG: GerMN domain-containing protein [Acidothermus sp.]|nr:GerMN domain-containing protein [Acidothermus sp.]MCL6537048.1 GerMN domain-containing protein [Acidothermus sp.]